MEIILYLSVAVIAVAFFILVVYLAKTLTSLQETLKSVSSTLDGLEGQMKGITTESTDLLHKTNLLAEDVQKKSEDLNTVVYAVKDVGRSIQEFNSSVRKVTKSVSRQMENNREKISQVVQWGNVAMELREKWQLKKSQNRDEASSVADEKNEVTRRGKIFQRSDQ
ncbi:DUF948 domain-containing protein [Bacillus sp. 2205SS5-2]|uniref:DUF948 domain-containing protein n=1 Tax=Bacillus sp. 2205SS5-2 TaxID=3109031 RepID=UPI0030055481